MVNLRDYTLILLKLFLIICNLFFEQYLELGVELREAGCPSSTSISEAEKINGSLVLV